FFSSRRRHTRFSRDWSSDVCSSDLATLLGLGLLTAGSGLAQTTPAPAAPALNVVKPKGLGLKDGDRFIFIGDSITHGCLYSQLRSEERRVGKECVSRWVRSAVRE